MFPRCLSKKKKKRCLACSWASQSCVAACDECFVWLWVNQVHIETLPEALPSITTSPRSCQSFFFVFPPATNVLLHRFSMRPADLICSHYGCSTFISQLALDRIFSIHLHRHHLPITLSFSGSLYFQYQSSTNLQMLVNETLDWFNDYCKSLSMFL